MVSDPARPAGAASTSHRPLRVAMIIGSAEVGGAEHLVLTLLRSLPRDEFECAVICPAGPIVASYAAAAFAVATFGHVGGHSFLNPITIVRMARLLRRWRIDVVHTSLFLSDVGGILAARLAGVPLIVSHIVGHNFHVTDERGLRWLRRQTASWLYRALYVLSHRLIAVSAAVKQDLIERPGIRVPAEKITVIHHSLPPADPHTAGETDEAMLSRYAITPDATVIAAIGSLYPLKGHRYLLEALATVRSSLPALRCVIVGDGPCRAELESLTGALGIADRVVFTGVVDDGVRDAIRRRSAAIVLPSMSEGLPVVLLEAMAEAKPIVASNIGGIPELVLDGITGLLVPAGDPTALAAAIVRLVSDPAEAARLGQAARQRFDEAFSREQMVERLTAVYECAL